MLPQRLKYEIQKPLVIKHLTSLVDNDRRLRFGGVLSDESIASYVDKQWDADGAWFGTFDGEELIAVVHVAITDNEAEIGLSVDPHYRDRKLGQKLFERAAFYIRSEGIQHVYMHCLSENAAMKHMAQKYNMTTVSQYGETDARAVVDAPYTPMDSVTEAVAQQLALCDNSIRVTSSMWSKYIERLWNVLPKKSMRNVNANPNDISDNHPSK